MLDEKLGSTFSYLNSLWRRRTDSANRVGELLNSESTQGVSLTLELSEAPERERHQGRCLTKKSMQSVRHPSPYVKDIEVDARCSLNHVYLGETRGPADAGPAVNLVSSVAMNVSQGDESL